MSTVCYFAYNTANIGDYFGSTALNELQFCTKIVKSVSEWDFYPYLFSVSC